MPGRPWQKGLTSYRHAHSLWHLPATLARVGRIPGGHFRRHFGRLYPSTRRFPAGASVPLMGSESSRIRVFDLGLHFTAKLALSSTTGIDRDEFVRVGRGDGDWIVCRRAAKRLLGQDAPDWFALDGCGQAEVVKSGLRRRVWRVEMSGGTVFVKECRPEGATGRLRCLVSGTACEREWRATVHARRQGVPTIEVLGVGVSRSHAGRAVLISGAHGSGQSLADVWRSIQEVSPHERQEAIRRLISSVADLFARSHNAGVFHRDAHPKNILVRSSRDGRYEPVFADLYGAVTRSMWGRAKMIFAVPAWRRAKMIFAVPAKMTSAVPFLPLAVRSLAQADQYFHRCASRSQRLRFVREYLGWEGKDNLCRTRPGRRGVTELAQRRVVVKSVLRSRRRLGAALARRRDRRMRQPGKYFCHLDLAGRWSAWVVLELARRHVFPEPHVPDRDADAWRASLEALLAGSELKSPSAFDWPDSSCQVEVISPHGLARAIWWRLAGSPYRREFVRSHRLRHRDRWSVLRAGVLERRRFLRVDQSALLTPVPAGYHTPVAVQPSSKPRSDTP